VAKPLSLIGGAHPLNLLNDHGYAFRIDLSEARRVLHDADRCQTVRTKRIRPCGRTRDGLWLV